MGSLSFWSPAYALPFKDSCATPPPACTPCPSHPNSFLGLTPRSHWLLLRQGAGVGESTLPPDCFCHRKGHITWQQGTKREMVRCAVPDEHWCGTSGIGVRKKGREEKGESWYLPSASNFKLCLCNVFLTLPTSPGPGIKIEVSLFLGQVEGVQAEGHCCLLCGML